MDIDKILKLYPKNRPPLPPKYKHIYTNEYQINRNGTSFMTRISMKLESWLHRRVVSRAIPAKNILELGAGTLNHVPYERTYSNYDVVEPFQLLYSGSKNLCQINTIYNLLTDISESNKYERIFSIAVLEHILDLPAFIAYSALILEKSGQFQASIPSQGGLLWYLTYNLTTGIAFYLRNRLNYNTLMNYEHVNTCSEILSIIRYFYKTVYLDRFPCPGKHLSFYTYIEAEHPNDLLCRAYLQNKNISCP